MCGGGLACHAGEYYVGLIMTGAGLRVGLRLVAPSHWQVLVTKKSESQGLEGPEPGGCRIARAAAAESLRLYCSPFGHPEPCFACWLLFIIPTSF